MMNRHTSLLAPLFSLALSCASTPADTRADTAQEERRHCPPRELPEGSLLPLEPEPAQLPPSSDIAFDVELSAASLERAIEQAVPSPVAQARGVHIGTPGRLSYVVHRAHPQVAFDSGELTAVLPLKITLQLCKPFAGFCPTYGQCTAEIDVVGTAKVDVPALTDVAPPKLHARVKRGCVLQPVGLDATGELRKVVNQELDKQRALVVREFKQGLTDLRSSLHSLGGRSAAPFRIADQDYCFTLEHAEYTSPTQHGDRLAIRGSLSGRLRPAETCSNDMTQFLTHSPRRAASLPAPHSSVAFSYPVPLVKWEKYIRSQLAKVEGAYALVALGTATYEGRPTLTLRLKDGECERTFRAQARVDREVLLLDNITAGEAIPWEGATTVGRASRWPLPRNLIREVAQQVAQAALVMERSGSKPPGFLTVSVETEPPTVSGTRLSKDAVLLDVLAPIRVRVSTP